jgi:hypothetical protein
MSARRKKVDPGSRGSVLGLTSAIERAMGIDGVSRAMVVLEAASALRDALVREKPDLSRQEKMGVIRSVAKAKVWAYFSGEGDDFQTYHALEEISSDLMSAL